MSTIHRRRLISEISRQNPFVEAATTGATPAEIKAEIVALLSPYVADATFLEELAIECLAPDAARLLQLRQDKWAFGIFEAVRPIYTASASASEVDCFQVFTEWQPELCKGNSGFWSLYHLRDRSVELTPEDAVFEHFRTIGSLIEGAIQPLLRELLCHVRIGREVYANGHPVRHLDFGLVVGELCDTSIGRSAFTPPPWRVRLNQWRNVAQHHSFKLENGRVLVEFGKPPNVRTESLSQDDLRLLFARVYGVFNAMSAARALFALNNHDRVNSLVNSAEAQVRPEILIVNLATALSTQGFELLDLTVNDGEVEAVVSDAVGGDSITRVAHATQFTYVVWRHFPRNRIQIRYRAHKDQRRFTFSVTGDVCRAIGRDEVPFETLANEIEIQVDADVEPA